MGWRKLPRLRLIAIDSQAADLDAISAFAKIVPSIELLGTFTKPKSGVRIAKTQQAHVMLLGEQFEETIRDQIVAGLPEGTMIISWRFGKETMIKSSDLVVATIFKPATMEKFLDAIRKVKYRYHKKMRKREEAILLSTI